MSHGEPALNDAHRILSAVDQAIDAVLRAAWAYRAKAVLDPLFKARAIAAAVDARLPAKVTPRSLKQFLRSPLP